MNLLIYLTFIISYLSISCDAGVRTQPCDSLVVESELKELRAYLGSKSKKDEAIEKTRDTVSEGIKARFPENQCFFQTCSTGDGHRYLEVRIKLKELENVHPFMMFNISMPEVTLASFGRPRNLSVVNNTPDRAPVGIDFILMNNPGSFEMLLEDLEWALNRAEELMGISLKENHDQRGFFETFDETGSLLTKEDSRRKCFFHSDLWSYTVESRNPGHLLRRMSSTKEEWILCARCCDERLLYPQSKIVQALNPIEDLPGLFVCVLLKNSDKQDFCAGTVSDILLPCDIVRPFHSALRVASGSDWVNFAFISNFYYKDLQFALQIKRSNAEEMNIDELLSILSREYQFAILKIFKSQDLKIVYEDRHEFIYLNEHMRVLSSESSYFVKSWLKGNLNNCIQDMTAVVGEFLKQNKAITSRDKNRFALLNHLPYREDARPLALGFFTKDDHEYIFYVDPRTHVSDDNPIDKMLEYGDKRALDVFLTITMHPKLILPTTDKEFWDVLLWSTIDKPNNTKLVAQVCVKTLKSMEEITTKQMLAIIGLSTEIIDEQIKQGKESVYEVYHVSNDDEPNLNGVEFGISIQKHPA